MAEALQRLHGREVNAVSGRVAVHYESASRAEDAIIWYLRAEARPAALRRRRAVDLLQWARTLLSDVPPAQRGPLELELLTELPAALVGVDGFASERIDGVQQRALELAARLAWSLTRAVAVAGETAVADDDHGVTSAPSPGVELSPGPPEPDSAQVSPFGHRASGGSTFS